MSDEIVFEPERNPLASVIVLAWRSGPFLLDCLRSVAENVRAVPYEVLLVLNEPTSELLIAVERLVFGATVLRTRVNVGYGGAHNLAARYARGEYLVLLNDDATIHPNWLETLVETAERRPDAGAVGGTTLFPDGMFQEAGNVIWSDGSTIKVGRGLPRESRKFDYERIVDFCSGASLLVRRSSWLALNGMDDRYYPAYYEDTDMCLRLRELGETVWYQPRSYISHRESSSTGNLFREYLFKKNKALLADRWSNLLASRVTPAPTSPAAIDRAAWLAAGGRKRILMIDDQVPEPRIGSGYPRAAEVYRTLQVDCGYQLTVFTSVAGGSKQNDALCKMGVAVVDGALEEHLDELFSPYHAAVISRPHNYERFAPLMRRLAPSTPIVYDAEALFHRRIERQASFAMDPAEATHLSEKAVEMRATEAEIASDADAIVTISDEEALFWSSHASAPVRVHGPLLSDVVPSAPGFEQRADLGYVAGWAGGGTSPNVDAVQWFAHEILPTLQARVPGARLFVTGMNPPPEALRVENPALCFLGSIDDLAAFYDSIRVVVVPMRVGAGVKNKTVEALQYGVPTVSTTVGAEGVPVDDGLHALLVSDNAADFANRVSALLDDRFAWELQRRKVLEQIERWRSSLSSEVWPEVLSTVIRDEVQW